MTLGGAFPSALLGSNFDEGSVPTPTPNEIARRAAGVAVVVGGMNVVVLRSFSVPFSAPFAVVGYMVDEGTVGRVANHRKLLRGY